MRETNAFAPGDEVLLEERAEVGAGARRLGDVRAPDRVGGAGLRDRVLERHLDAVRVEVRDDLLRAVDPLLLRAVAGGLDPLRVDPVAADVEVLRVAVDARHLDRGHALDPDLLGGRERLGHAGDAVVVGQRHRRDPGLGGGADDVRRLELAVGDGGVGLQVDHAARRA